MSEASQLEPVGTTGNLQALIAAAAQCEGALDFDERFTLLLGALCEVLGACSATAVVVPSLQPPLVPCEELTATLRLDPVALGEHLRWLVRDPAWPWIRSASGAPTQLSPYLTHARIPSGLRKFLDQARIKDRLSWSCPMPDGSTLVVAIYRAPEQDCFSPEELRTARGLVPLLLAAGRREVLVSLLRRRGTARGGAPVLVLGQDGTILFSDAAATALLRAAGASARRALVHQVLHRTPSADLVHVEVQGQDLDLRGESLVLTTDRETTYLVQLEPTPSPAQDLLERLELTARQREVASLVAQGLSNAAVAARLGTSESFVRKYVSEIFRRTGTTSRTELAGLVWRMARPE